MTKQKQNRRLRARNIAVFCALVGLVVLIYLVTIVKIKITHHL